MLKRIQDIKSVGCFYDDHPAAVQFEELTIVFGENCYGKSTLCDIFRSLADDSPDYILDRVSIPNPRNQDQNIQLTFTALGDISESNVIFRGERWVRKIPSDQKIYVFDTDFIHRNVFTGLTIERKNQENITQFVLGEAGVNTAKDIEKLNSQLRSINKTIKGIIRTTFDGINDIEKFLYLEINESIEQLKSIITDKTNELGIQKKLADNLEKAKNRKEPKQISIPENIEGFVQQVNNCLTNTYEHAHENASEAVENHIKRKTQNTVTSKNWLKNGLEQIANDYCPFCGQLLEKEANELIEIYRSCFDEEFKTYERETRKVLDQIPSVLNSFQCQTIPELIQENNYNINLYPELTKNQKYDRISKLVYANAKGLKKLWNRFQTKFEIEASKLSVKINQKSESIYLKIPSWNCPGLLTAYGNLKIIVVKYNKLIEQILYEITDFKADLDPITIARRIYQIEETLSDINLKLRRKESQPACEELIGLFQQKKTTEETIERLKERLDKEQSEYLNKCFESINKLFSKLGSGPFQITKEIGERGNMPVIQLRASYAGVTIKPDKLKYFFSESDRRALALSIYWAKIDSLTDQQKQNAILILDDPVTSFDDGRIERTIRLMEGKRPSFRQIIVLSHYPLYLKSFFERASLNSSGIQLCKIVRTNESSKIEYASPADFVETAHHIKFRHIKSFIDREHTENVSQDLRIFLETEVKSRYRKQIVENGLNSLQFKELLDTLLELDVINQEKRTVLEELRQSLNPEHHVWTERSLEDRIALSSDVLEFVYESL